jgi:flagellin-like hook-associated protein FlgL
MSLGISISKAGLSVLNQLKKTTQKEAISLNRLSTGLKVSSGKDNPQALQSINKLSSSLQELDSSDQKYEQISEALSKTQDADMAQLVTEFETIKIQKQSQAYLLTAINSEQQSTFKKTT